MNFEETIEEINKGFKFLKEDCSHVSLVGFVPVSDIPSNILKEEFDRSDFNHQFSDTKSDGWDEANFWGHIYLQLHNETYMNFEVHA